VNARLREPRTPLTEDASSVRLFLAGVRRQLAMIAIAHGATLGLAIAIAFVFVPWRTTHGVMLPAGVAFTLTVLGAAIAYAATAAQRSRAASLVERRAPECRNLVLTADEMMQAKREAPIASVVYRQAANAVRTLRADLLFPAARAFAALAAAMALFAGVVFVRTLPARTASSRAGEIIGVPVAVQNVTITVAAPSYVRRAPGTLRDPVRIDALVGSTITLAVEANATSLNVETLSGRQSVTSRDGTFAARVRADSDGFIAIEPVGANGTKGVRRLIGVTVQEDRAPRVRIVAPARDMMLPDGARSLDLAIDADDDIALASLRLRYTQVSGSGERYTFKEGELPLQVTRTSASGWKGRAHWNLAPLALEAGDMVVYRAVAADARPGAIPTESDSYIAEVLMPGSDAAAGFAIDPDQERYALSQQMIIVKTERLSARHATTAAQAFADEANDIAVEQRRVRAQFVFMMGGELADEPLPSEDMTTLHEEAEADGESDILAGRGANAGRVALVAAIRSMSSAATLLNSANVTDALEWERTALKALERAFSHTRIILRALSEAEKLDMSRRMTGPLLEAGREARASATPESNARVVALRGVLAGVAALAAGTPVGASDTHAAAAVALAERVLRVAPSETALQAIASHLNGAAVAFGKAQDGLAHRELDNAAVLLTAVVRSDVGSAPPRTRFLGSDQLGGALADALRAHRGGR
jgi:hypothetical protein